MSRKILLLMLFSLSLGLTSNVFAWTITGTVTCGGSGLAGVVVTASGGTQGTTYSQPSNASGAFTANHTQANPVTCTPTLAGYTFSPVNRTYNVTANKTGCNFTATQLTYTISGNVGTLVGVTMNGLPGNPVTTSGGAYTATVGYGWNGTVTPAMTGYSFSPVNKTYANVTANQSAQNYTPTAITYTISGSVGTLNGVTMNGLPGNPVTSGGGLYSATVGQGWNGTVTPSFGSYGFNPSQMTYSNVTANQTNQNYGTIADVDLLGRWNFDDSTANDVSGYGHNGTLNGNASIIDDPEKGKVLSLDGAGDFVDLGNGSWTNPGNNLTITAWIKVDTFDVSYQTVLAKGLYTYRLSRNGTTSGMCAYLNHGSGSNYNHVDGTSTVNNGNWHFVAVSYNGTTIKLYVDNQMQDSGTLSTLYTNTANLCIGRNTDNTARDWQGWIDDVRLYKKVLSDTDIEAVAGTTYTISGTVGTLDGVTMSGLPGNPATSGGGNYSATVAYGWDGTVTPVKSGYTFTPASVTYSNVISNMTSQNYTPVVPTCTISGTVGTLDGVVMDGFPVETITTAGSYSATVNSGWTGTITPTKDGYTFSPTNKTYSNVTTNQSAQNYTPALITYTISGHVGNLDGVTMNGLPGNPVTSGGGAYSATVTYIWSGTVTPAKTGYTFSPSYRVYSNVGSNLTEDYTPIINTYTISGYAGSISDVTISGLPGNPLSSTGGAYTGTVTYGWSGTVTPTKDLYNFTPANKTYSNVTSDQDAQDYTVATALGDPTLVGWWPFNGNATDYSGYGHDGTVTGASYVTSDIGTVLDFESVDYVSIPSSTFATISNKITIALWQYGDVALQPQNDTIFEGWDASNHRILNSHLPYGNSMVYFDAGYAGTIYDRINKTASAASQYEGQWNHWVFTKDLSTEQMKIYLNGVLWHSGTAKSKSMSGITQFKIGSAADGTYNYDGMICEFRIYNRVVSATEVTDLYNASYEASDPSPANGATDVATSADLSWTAGYLAADTAGHDVYFGTDVTAVTNRDASVFKGSQNTATYDPGTLTGGVTYYWAVDEVNDYYANSPWLGDVQSFTTVGTGPTCPICGGQDLCDLHIPYLNTRLGRISGVQNINIIQVTMDGHTSVPMASIQSAANRFASWVESASFGRLKLKIYRSKSYHGTGSINTIKNGAINFNRTLGGDPLITAIVFPKGAYGYNNSGQGYIFLGGSTISWIHESGHILGLAHSGAIMDNGKREDYRDSSSWMSAFPSQNYAVNQQQWLGWTSDRENVNITDCLNKVSYIDVPLRPVDGGGIVSDIPHAYVYEIPNTDSQIWIAIPKRMDNNQNAIHGGEIFVYQYNNCRGKTGMCMGSTRIGRISNPKTSGPKEFNGITIDPISWISTPAQFDGKTVDNFSQITVRISLTDQPVDDPNDYNEPDLTPLADWNFSEAAGTVLRDTINDGTTTPATWTTNRTGITATGEETLLFRPTTNTIDGSVTYFDLAGAGSAITSGKVWTVVEVNDFNFAGATVGERLRFGMVNAMSTGNLTAEFQIRRVASNSIHLIGFATGTLPTTGVQICTSNTFNGLLEICTEYDFDARTYQIFYRINGSGDWNSIAAAALYGTNVGNALRLCAGDSASAGTGSWADTGEYFHIGRIYLTTSDPKIEPANVAPDVSIVTPDDGDTFTTGSNINLYALANDTDGNVASVDFYNGTALLGQGQITVQPTIVNAAGQATIHGSTAQYSNGSINTWTNINDWVSWTAAVVKPTTFEVWVDYSCKNTSAGSTYRVEVGDQIVQGTVASTGTDWLTFDSVYLGTVTIAEANNNVAVNVIPETITSAVMNLQNVTLIPVEDGDSYKYTWSNVPAGAYTLTAKATDDDDANTVSDPVVITVQP